ncbi:hypothetical protein JOD69_003004 [Methylocaldum sp. RMAD-M]|nr:hypothetical protein [Methylocaldum sp. RMAD-M]
MKIVTIILLVLGALLALGVFLAALPWIEVAVLNSFFAKEIATNSDLPWAAPGRKARYYSLKSWDWNNGITRVPAWGSNSWRKEYPLDTANKAFAFLEKHRAMNAWLAAGTFETYSVYDQRQPGDVHHQDDYGNTIVTYSQRVAPYRFFIVSIEPTVIVMQSAPELPAWQEEYVQQGYSRDSRWIRWYMSLPEQQRLPDLVWLQNPLEFGTELPRGSGWKWFSPDLEQLPTDLPLVESGSAVIPLKHGQLKFRPSESGWHVVRE